MVTPVTPLRVADAHALPPPTVQRLPHTDDAPPGATAAALQIWVHELRNQLTPMRLAIGLLRDASDPQRATVLRERLQRQLQGVHRLVDDLAAVSEARQTLPLLALAPVDLCTLVGEVADTARPTFDERRLRFSLRVPGAPVWVLGDALRLTQVLLNVLANAARYTPPGGRVRMALVRRAATARVTVTDTGCGIRAAELPHIFQLHMRGATARRLAVGSGIGLHVVRCWVEAHGGSVGAASDGPGCGARFTIDLPRPQALPKTALAATG